MNRVEIYGFVLWIGTFFVYGTCIEGSGGATHYMNTRTPQLISIDTLPYIHIHVYYGSRPRPVGVPAREHPSPAGLHLLPCQVRPPFRHAFSPSFPLHHLPTRKQLPSTSKRDWAIAVPAYLFTAFALSGVCYVAINLLSTAPLDSFQTLTGTYVHGFLVPVRVGHLSTDNELQNQPPTIPTIPNHRLMGAQAHDSAAGGGGPLGAQLWGFGHWCGQRGDVWVGGRQWQWGKEMRQARGGGSHVSIVVVEMTWVADERKERS